MLVGWLILNVPVNNFSVMLGRSHRFLGITSTFWDVNVPCSRTQHGLTRVGHEPPTSGSGVRGINHQAIALPMCECNAPYKMHVVDNLQHLLTETILMKNYTIDFNF